MVPLTSTFFFSIVYEVLFFALSTESNSFTIYESIEGMTITVNEYIFSSANVSDRDTSIW